MSKSFYRWHWISQHRGYGIPGLFQNEKELFSKTPNDIVKTITIDEKIPYLEDLPAGCNILVRYQPMTENFGNEGGRIIRDEADAIAQADRDTACTARLADWAERQGVARARLWFSYKNELRFPEGGGHEPAALGNRYFCRVLDRAHIQKTHSVVGEFGAGWPPDRGVPDSFANYDPFHEMYDKLDGLDRWSQHAYWGSFGVDFWWNFLAGNWTTRPAWMRGKKLWLTECGSDRVPNNSKAASTSAGWMTYPESSLLLKAKRYVSELAHFEQLARKDPDCEYAFIFTLDGDKEDWGRFELENEDFMKTFLPYVTSDVQVSVTPPAPPPVVPPLVSPVSPPTPDFWLTLKAAFGAQAVDLRTALATNGNYSTRPLSVIKRYVIHHTVAPSTTAWSVVASYHVNTNGWPRIGYHIGVGPDGTVSLLNSLTSESYHCGTFSTPEDDNLDTIGICVAGNFHPGQSVPTEQPTAAALASLRKLLPVLDSHLGLACKVIGHRDIAHETVCPGDNLYPFVATLRNAPSVPPTGLPSAAALLAAGEQHRLIKHNLGAGLEKVIDRDGFAITSNEFDLLFDGVSYMCQQAEDPHSGTTRVYFAVVGLWDDVKHVEK